MSRNPPASALAPLVTTDRYSWTFGSPGHVVVTTGSDLWPYSIIDKQVALTIIMFFSRPANPDSSEPLQLNLPTFAKNVVISYLEVPLSELPPGETGLMEVQYSEQSIAFKTVPSGQYWKASDLTNAITPWYFLINYTLP